MTDRFKATAERDADGCAVLVRVDDPGLHGVMARLDVTHRAHVKHGSPVHHEINLITRRVTLQHGDNRIALGTALDKAFAYEGDKLDLRLTARLKLDDGVIFDSDVEVDLREVCRLAPRMARKEYAKSVHSPSDRFSFFANLRAIPAGARAKVLWLLLVGGPVIAINLLVGTRDQFVPDSRVWFYDHRASDGESESPLMKALLGSGAAGAAIWAMIAAQLRRYMTFEAQRPEGTISRDTRWQPSTMVTGKSRVPLQQVTLRLVAYNCEHGQYTKREKSGNTTRSVTKNFSNNACGVVLYERLLPFVPAGVELQGYLQGDVELRPLFDALYPPLMLGMAHGLSVQFEMQLLHPEYVDQEVILDEVQIDMAGFYRA